MPSLKRVWIDTPGGGVKASHQGPLREERSPTLSVFRVPVRKGDLLYSFCQNTGWIPSVCKFGKDEIPVHLVGLTV